MTQEENKKKKSKLPLLILVILILVSMAMFASNSNIKIFDWDTKPKEQTKTDDIIVNDHDDFLGLYEEEIEEYLLDEINKEIVQTLEVKLIQKYRLHLINLASLSNKFLEQKNYSKEIKFLLTNNAKYDDETTESLLKLKDFNDKFLHEEFEEYIKKKCEQCSMTKNVLSKIFDVLEVNPEYANMLQEKENMKQNLKQVQNYIYSQEFLNMHVNYD